MAKSPLLFIGSLTIIWNVVWCVELDVPRPTEARLPDLKRAPDPEPTARAILVEEESNLLGRNIYNTLCGYVNGNIDYPLTCGGGYVCATAAYYDAAGCCNPDDLENCFLAETCIPYGYTCEGACLEDYVAYTSCGYLTPFCLTKFYNYGGGYYEYDCATESGFFTIEASALNAPATQYIVTTAAVIVQTKASTATATPLADSSGSVTNIYNGNNDCQSNCGTGNSNGGSNNNVGNGKSGTSASIPLASTALQLLSAFCASLLVLL